MSEAWNLKFFLKFVQQERSHGDQGQVVHAHDHEYLAEAKALAGHDLGLARQLEAGHHVGQGRVLDQIDDLVAAAGQGATEGLRDDDPDQGREGREAQGLGRQDLAAPDGEQPPRMYSEW